jgi:hypothetical protein
MSVKFKIDEKVYEVPNFISIENYSKIFKVKDSFSDEYFGARLINIVVGSPVEDLLQGDYDEVMYLSSYILSILPQEKPKFVDNFELDGVKYGFFQNWKDLTFAEFVDMDTISTKKTDELLDMLHILAAVFYRPIVEQKSEHEFKIEKYDVSTMKERAELFKKKLDVKYVLGAQFFFIKFANRYSNYSHLSSIPKISMMTKMKIIWNMRKIIWKTLFKKPTDGILSSTEFLETILRNTNISIIKK